MRRISGLALVVSAVLYLAPLLLDAPLTDPDEGLHAGISQEMYERGEFVVPRLLGQPFLDKPILFFWAQIASIGSFGMTTAAARLPGMLFALLGVASTGWLTRVLFDSATGWIAATCYATMTLPFMLAQAPVHDIALVPLVNLALGCLWRAGAQTLNFEVRTSKFELQTWNVGVAGIALGLSILTKGLEGIAVVGIGYGAYLVITRGVRWAMVWQAVVVLAIAALIAMPWYVAMSAREPGYLEYYFVDRHFLGFTTDSQRHGGQPWWFYAPLAVFGALPWILYVRPRDIRRHATGSTASPELFLATWFVGALMLLSTSNSKTATYILPAMPAIAILAGRSWAPALVRDPADDLDVRLRVGAMAHAALLFVVTSLTPWATSRYGDQPVGAGEALIFGGLGVVWIRLFVSLRKSPPVETWLRLVMVTGVTYALAFVLFGPPLAQSHSARDLSDYFNRADGLPATIYVMDGRLSFVYYLRPELRRQLRADQIQRVSVEQLAAMDEWPRDAVLTLPADLSGRLARVPRLTDATRRFAGRYLIVSP